MIFLGKIEQLKFSKKNGTHNKTILPSQEELEQYFKSIWKCEWLINMESLATEYRSNFKGYLYVEKAIWNKQGKVNCLYSSLIFEKEELMIKIKCYLVIQEIFSQRCFFCNIENLGVY